MGVWGRVVPRDAVLRIRSSRYLVPTNRHSGESGDFFVRATCDSIAGARDSTPRGLEISGSGAGTSKFPAAVPLGRGHSDSGNGAQLQQSSHQRHRRLGALAPPSIALCRQTLAQDGAHGGITDVATDRFSFHGQLRIAISGAFVREGRRVSSGGQHG